jgi:hypothetical protein
MNLSELVAKVKEHFDNTSVLEAAAEQAIAARDKARAATAAVLDDAIAGLQKLRAGLEVPVSHLEPAAPTATNEQ